MTCERLWAGPSVCAQLGRCSTLSTLNGRHGPLHRRRSASSGQPSAHSYEYRRRVRPRRSLALRPPLTLPASAPALSLVPLSLALPPRVSPQRLLSPPTPHARSQAWHSNVPTTYVQRCLLRIAYSPHSVPSCRPSPRFVNLILTDPRQQPSVSNGEASRSIRAYLPHARSAPQEGECDVQSVLANPPLRPTALLQNSARQCSPNGRNGEAYLIQRQRPPNATSNSNARWRPRTHRCHATEVRSPSAPSNLYSPLKSIALTTASATSCAPTKDERLDVVVLAPSQHEELCEVAREHELPEQLRRTPYNEHVFSRQDTCDIAERYGEHARGGAIAAWIPVSLTSPPSSLTAPRVSTAKPDRADVRTSI